MAVLRVVVTQSTESLLGVAMRSYFLCESSGIACDTRGYGSSISTERNSVCRQTSQCFRPDRCTQNQSPSRTKGQTVLGKTQALLQFPAICCASSSSHLI